MELVIKIENLAQARAVAYFLPVFFGQANEPSPREAQKVLADIQRLMPELFRVPAAKVAAIPEGQVKAASTTTLPAEAVKKQVAASAEKPTPLEAAIEEKKAEDPTTDPFAQLQAGSGGPAAETTEKVERPKKERKQKKTEPAAKEKSAEDKPLTLDDIKKASTIALELVGAPLIQEALAKFNAVDEQKKALRMSALRPQDYALYVEFLKKKVNDAAKEWPAQ